MNEKPIQNQIMLAVGGRPDTRVFRNTVGVGKHMDGSFVRFGLCPGSGDLIGWHTVTITPDMVGQKFARFLSIEVKRSKGNKASDEQINWTEVVARFGGIAIVARSPDDVTKILDLQGPR